MSFLTVLEAPKSKIKVMGWYAFAGNTLCGGQLLSGSSQEREKESFPLFCKDNSLINPTLIRAFNLYYLPKGPMSKCSDMESWVSTYGFGAGAGSGVERILRAGVVLLTGSGGKLLRAVLMGGCGEPAWRQEDFSGLSKSEHARPPHSTNTTSRNLLKMSP